MIDNKKIMTCGWLGAIAIASAVFAQTAPTTQDQSQTLTATITDVVGNVQERESETSAWRKAVVGMELNENGELRTGPRSAVRFSMPGGQTITLDRLGVIKILTAVQQNGKITTDLGLKYGRTRYDIRKAGVQYSSTIRSPGSTLAIRGTDVTYEDSAPFPPHAESIQGRAQFLNGHAQFISFGGVGNANVDVNHQGPGDVSFDNTNDDPRTDFSGHDATEEKIITEYPLLSGFDPGSSASLLSVIQSTQTQETIHTPLLAGPLEFDLSWQSVNYAAGTAAATNLDLSVTDPLNETVSKTNPQVGTGGVAAVYSGDNKGATGAGTESVVYGQQFPQGQYTLNVNHVSGDPAQVILSVERNNQVIKTIGLSQQNPLILTQGQTFTTTVDVGAADSTGVTTDVVKHKHH